MLDGQKWQGGISQTVSDELRLKKSRVCLPFVAYLRQHLLKLHEMHSDISCFQIPTSVEYEILVFGYYRQFVEGLLKEFENEAVFDGSVPAHHRLFVVHVLSI